MRGSRGSPHSSHSLMVSGISGSSMVVTQSTNGTSATTARQRRGAIENTAPWSRPPAESPRETIRSGAAQPRAASMSATAMKSVKVLRLRSSRPSSGWTVTPNGTDTCQQPGTGASDCGAGVAAGQKLQFQLLYASGSAYFDQQNAAIQTSEALAGIHIVLKAEPFNTLVATTATCNAASHSGSVCNWQLQQFGYQPYSVDPNGSGIFNTNAVNNYGGYSSPQLDQLINETEYGSSSSAFDAYEDYTAQQLPWLWLPDPSQVAVFKSNLAGVAPTSPFDFLLNPEVWYYVKSGS